MFLIIGSVVVWSSVFGGYVMQGGHLEVLWQPFEALIIIGAAVGAYIIGNPKTVISATAKGLGHALKGPRYDKDSYIELLLMMYQVFRLAKSKGMLVLETHVKTPKRANCSPSFPIFMVTITWSRSFVTISA